MSECLRCGQSSSNGLFCDQCHSSLVERFQKRWCRDDPSTVSPVNLNASVYNVGRLQGIKRFSFSLPRSFSVLFTLLIVPVFVVATVQASFAVSEHQPVSTSSRTVSRATITSASRIKRTSLSMQSFNNLKNDDTTSSSPALSVLGVSPDYLMFSVIQGQPDPPDQAVAIANIGAGDLDWSAQNDDDSSSWLHMNTTTGSLTGGQITQLILHMYVTGLIAGSYRANVLTVATDSSGLPSVAGSRIFTVQLDILENTEVQIS